ncbi:MAG: hypothetical protein A2528_02190 [Candidatus Staskawiczbacteria bacterium RIFOXYD2_FULL_37_9]|uniref:Uncharacterized protein n=1 Tax=Candidatus Staskawiczbacteria bacterium RIFOXYB1_FULL_37_44 TaxID=1802223 RepID=A0A1G2IWT5_9BACT|nr:MAG: hypothetical protein A2358_00980 [Candidatus Staskawiczbacteria bacterium RIFOXYB1_FULL_37_44]OGZ84739.1 MAG: hypothetical protein A2416_00990 [Candidatus Staskawiczbacteria bacterium RIFOXYC1_FULL_37_52]OGZ88442.1 MAG: hypothetical protein A2444_02125 [Candidatus Staskawiczbacteria bacterium RIFOXYC2_FULL_37_19]OGZ89634.1 MAG: hypothetical protein A2581_01490 [Candidatus Staskawiczbacteria bacterium RIFOXYD1_FULL_37_110]OGZ92787.1 MAG: hypothetical protein A2528_02190 [Candidatus Stask
MSEFKSGNRKIEECIPELLEEGKIYNFLKKDQRNYYLHGEVPLLKTKGNSILSKPIASILILEATHFEERGQIYTKGTYKVVKVIPEDQIYFNGFSKSS